MVIEGLTLQGEAKFTAGSRIMDNGIVSTELVPSPSPTTQSCLLALPQEVKNIIWTHYYADCYYAYTFFVETIVDGRDVDAGKKACSLIARDKNSLRAVCRSIDAETRHTRRSAPWELEITVNTNATLELNSYLEMPELAKVLPRATRLSISELDGARPLQTLGCPPPFNPPGYTGLLEAKAEADWYAVWIDTLARLPKLEVLHFEHRVLTSEHWASRSDSATDKAIQNGCLDYYFMPDGDDDGVGLRHLARRMWFGPEVENRVAKHLDIYFECVLVYQDYLEKLYDNNSIVFRVVPGSFIPVKRNGKPVDFSKDLVQRLQELRFRGEIVVADEDHQKDWLPLVRLVS